MHCLGSFLLQDMFYKSFKYLFFEEQNKTFTMNILGPAVIRINCKYSTRSFLFTDIRHICPRAVFFEDPVDLFRESYCWFSHDVTKLQTSELLILLRFYFHDVLEQLKTNIQTNFHSKWVLGLVIDYAWISKLLRDVAFTWRTRELLCWFKRWLISGNSAIWTVLVLE